MKRGSGKLPSIAWRDHIRAELKAKGIANFDLAFEIERSATWVSNVLNGHLPIDEDMERKIEQTTERMDIMHIRFDPTTAEQLRRDLKVKGYSINEVGRKLGISMARLRNLINCKNKMDPKEMARIVQTIENLRSRT